MSNIKVGSKVYRDIEKMNHDELTAVAKAIYARMNDIANKGKALRSCNPHVAMRQVALLDKEFKSLELRMTLIEGRIKGLMTKDIKANQAKAKAEASPTVGIDIDEF